MKIFSASLARAMLLAAGVSMICASQSAMAQGAADDFYRGKDVRILIGAGVGGTYGLYAQLAARHMGKHIPGNPNLVLQTMPGAGGNVALAYSYTAAPKDGTLIHLIHSDVLFETLLNPAVKFNAKDYLFIGRIADADSVTLSTRASGIKTIDDAKTREVTMGSTGITNVFSLSALMMNRTAGTKFKVIAGYKGASDIAIAMERGELDSSGMSLANALTLHGDKLKTGDFQPVFAISSKRLPEFPNVPAMTEFGSPEDKILMEIYVSTGELGRPLAFPPGVSAQRLAVMREAFTKMMKDPDFLAETKKADIPVSPMSGEDMAVYVNKVMSAPAAQIEAARKLHAELIANK